MSIRKATADYVALQNDGQALNANHKWRTTTAPTWSHSVTADVA